MSDIDPEQPIAAWLDLLAAKRSTPGGGAAAALVAAVGAALGAMAARYTTGERWVDRSEEAGALAVALDRARARLQAAVDEDADAYSAWRHSRREDADPAEKRLADERCRAVPLKVFDCCAELSELLAAFLPRCNPQLTADCRAAIHLLAGAGRAAWQILLVNDPDDSTLRRVQARLGGLNANDAAAQHAT